METKQELNQTVPNSTAVLVLGILSIVLCWCYGIVGIALGIIALVLASKGKEALQSKPEIYSMSSINNLKAGKICAIIGLSLSALTILYMLFMVLFYGALFSALPWEEMIDESKRLRDFEDIY